MIRGAENGINGCYLVVFNVDIAFAHHFIATHHSPPHRNACSIIAYTEKILLCAWKFLQYVNFKGFTVTTSYSEKYENLSVSKTREVAYIKIIKLPFHEDDNDDGDHCVAS